MYLFLVYHSLILNQPQCAEELTVLGLARAQWIALSLGLFADYLAPFPRRNSRHQEQSSYTSSSIMKATISALRTIGHAPLKAHSAIKNHEADNRPERTQESDNDVDSGSL
jgi:hypothetical protein